MRKNKDLMEKSTKVKIYPKMKSRTIKTLIFASTLYLFQNLSCANSINKPKDTAKRKLLWNDEFSGIKIDETKWNINHNVRRKDPNGNDAWWHKDNAYLEKGSLVIRTSKIGNTYAGAAINTQGKFERTFGYYETRVKLQKEQGHWGAVWLFAQSVKKVGNEGRDGTEIDIFESPYVGLGKDSVQVALHYDGYGIAHKKMNKVVTGMKLNDGNWHTYAVEWNPEVYKFYYDDKLVWETNFGGISQVPLHLIISDEVGDWGNKINIFKAKLPDYMLVDYIRVYNKK